MAKYFARSRGYLKRYHQICPKLMSLFCKYDVGSLEIKINDHPLEIDALSHETDFLKTDSLPSEACSGQSCLSKITVLQVREVARRNHCFFERFQSYNEFHWSTSWVIAYLWYPKEWILNAVLTWNMPRLSSTKPENEYNFKQVKEPCNLFHTSKRSLAIPYAKYAGTKIECWEIMANRGSHRAQEREIIHLST